MPEQPIINARASLYGPEDSRPEWSEGWFQVERNGEIAVALDITRSGGERIIEALHGALHPWSSAGVQAQVREELDAVTERLVAGVSQPEDKGKAQGLTFALAVMENPYAPDFPAVKRAALERAGAIKPPEETTDPQTLWLRGLGMIALRSVADEAHLKNYRKMDRETLVSSLDQFDLDRWRLPAPAQDDSDADVLFE